MKLFMQKKKRKGFTLVELVVVVAIIAILAFIAAPKFTSMTENARIATFESNHEVAKSAISLFMAENGGQFPKDGAVDKLGEDISKYIDGGELTGKPSDSQYGWQNQVLTSTMSGLSKNAIADINAGKRPGKLVNGSMYQLTYDSVISGN